MKRTAVCLSLLAAVLVLAALLPGCGRKDAPPKEPAETTETIEGFRTYHKMSDGSWSCGGCSYKYRLEISGRMPNAAKDSTFVYLSNLEEIPFDRAWKAAGLSSFTGDYFSPEDAVLVELK